MAGKWVAIMVGLLLVAAGIARVIWAFRAESLGRGALKLLLGGLTLLAGLMVLANPLFGLGMLTLMLAGYFIVDGMFEIMGASRSSQPKAGVPALRRPRVARPRHHDLAPVPVSGAWAVGILVGVKLLFAGLSMVFVGSAVREMGRAAS